MKKKLLLLIPHLMSGMTSFHCEDNVVLSFPNQDRKVRHFTLTLHSITLQIIIEQLINNPESAKAIIDQYKTQESKLSEFLQNAQILELSKIVFEREE